MEEHLRTPARPVLAQSTVSVRMSSSPYVLAFELGAARIRAAVFDLHQRRIGELQSIPTMAKQLMVVTLMNLKRAGEQARREAGVEEPPLAVGMGSVGGADQRTGCLLGLESLPSLRGFCISRFIESEFGAPLYLENDANCFTLAEALIGAGRGHPIVLGVTLGAGFGCGTVIHGRIHSGASGTAGELVYGASGEGPLDQLLCTSGVGRFYTRITGKAAPTPKQLGDMAEAGDSGAVETWREYGRAVGHALGVIVAVVDPSICVIGGPVGRHFGWFQQSLDSALREHLTPPAAGHLKIAASQLDHQAGVAGAAKYAFQRLAEIREAQRA